MWEMIVALFIRAFAREVEKAASEVAEGRKITVTVTDKEEVYGPERPKAE